MQKQAKIQANRYAVTFAPLPVMAEEAMYFDHHAVELPFAEDFPQLHYHDRYEIGICESGEGLFLAGDSFYSISEGDLIFISPELRHYSRSLHEDALCRCRFAYLRRELVACVLSSVCGEDSVSWQAGATAIPAVIHGASDARVAQLLGEILTICQEERADAAAMAALRISTLLLEARRFFPGTDASWQGRPHAHGRATAADEVAEFLSLHYRESHSARELAELCHLSESQLRRQFWAGYGMPPIAYRNRLRCRIASELLCRTDLSVLEIAEQVGYPTSADFYRAFRNTVGMAPTEYRKSRGGEVPAAP